MTRLENQFVMSELRDLMDRYLVLSSDGHAGLPPERYREYLDPKYQEEFDNRIAAEIETREEAEYDMQIADYNNAWREEFGKGLMGAWDSDTRNKVLDADGVVAEVLFSDGLTERNAPPFNASHALEPRDTTPELQWAGSRAHNRWMAEFCAESPLRRIGVGLVPAFFDMDETLKEIRWVKENGLKSIVLPYLFDGFDNYNHSRYDPMWALIEDLGLVINFHSGGAPAFDRSTAGWLGIYVCEYPFWMTRPLFSMIFGGVFDRYPRLKICFTEAGGDFWWPWMMHMMDFRAAPKKGSAKIADHSIQLKKMPSEYFNSNVWVASSGQMNDANAQDYHKIGMDRILWGTDYPHPEGTWPNTPEQMIGSLAELSEADIEAVLGMNLAALYELDLEPLNAIAVRIGPKKSAFRQAA